MGGKTLGIGGAEDESRDDDPEPAAEDLASHEASFLELRWEKARFALDELQSEATALLKALGRRPPADAAVVDKAEGFLGAVLSREASDCLRAGYWDSRPVVGAVRKEVEKAYEIFEEDGVDEAAVLRAATAIGFEGAGRRFEAQLQEVVALRGGPWKAAQLLVAHALGKSLRKVQDSAKKGEPGMFAGLGSRSDKPG